MQFIIFFISFLLISYDCLAVWPVVQERVHPSGNVLQQLEVCQQTDLLCGIYAVCNAAKDTKDEVHQLVDECCEKVLQNPEKKNLFALYKGYPTLYEEGVIYLADKIIGGDIKSAYSILPARNLVVRNKLQLNKLREVVADSKVGPEDDVFYMGDNGVHSISLKCAFENFNCARQKKIPHRHYVFLGSMEATGDPSDSESVGHWYALCIDQDKDGKITYSVMDSQNSSYMIGDASIKCVVDALEHYLNPSIPAEKNIFDEFISTKNPSSTTNGVWFSATMQKIISTTVVLGIGWWWFKSATTEDNEPIPSANDQLLFSDLTMQHEPVMPVQQF